jgi:hypothetical protein
MLSKGKSTKFFEISLQETLRRSKWQVYEINQRIKRQVDGFSNLIVSFENAPEIPF